MFVRSRSENGFTPGDRSESETEPAPLRNRVRWGLRGNRSDVTTIIEGSSTAPGTPAQKPQEESPCARHSLSSPLRSRSALSARATLRKDRTRTSLRPPAALSLLEALIPVVASPAPEERQHRVARRAQAG